ncbi:hypothetical protein JY651_40120 [Pyxidicoccus parkwayensis]|uniref:Uncharacterized protein n=1 Tax=Pyxidicoccus parkwayensis TaxID=2813578 RepID=A0ABX7NVB2_9BACT|nr:hypothetical protein [Pyxidicoccus parkwaysis]QSQ21331.1 hypothetical protein JY651_40120 [Pyxidicoccus parkwaysis]
MTALEEDRSIVFPEFFEKFAQKVGEPPGIYELDGATLRAIRIAADDFLPADAPHGACWESRAAHRYRVTRREDIIFVRIDVDLAACDSKVLPLDSGVEYAIRADGRILRRVFDGEPVERSSTAVPDRGAPADAGEPALTPPPGSTWGKPSPTIPSGWLDSGTIHQPTEPDGGPSSHAP